MSNGKSNHSSSTIRLFLPFKKNSQLIGKDPDAGKDWRQKEKKVAEDEMIGWHHWLNGHELGQTPGDGEGQGGLAGMLQSMGTQRVGHDLGTEQEQPPPLKNTPSSISGFVKLKKII